MSLVSVGTAFADDVVEWDFIRADKFVEEVSRNPARAKAKYSEGVSVWGEIRAITMSPFGNCEITLDALNGSHVDFSMIMDVDEFINVMRSVSKGDVVGILGLIEFSTHYMVQMKRGVIVTIYTGNGWKDFDYD